MAACTLQQQHLQHIASHLPTYLPSLRSPEVAGPSAAGGGTAKENSRGATNAAAAAEGGGGAKKRAPAPRRWVLMGVGYGGLARGAHQDGCGCSLLARTNPSTLCRYITGDELASVSSYMRSRLTADKCNAALDELAGLAEVGGMGGG